MALGMETAKRLPEFLGNPDRRVDPMLLPYQQLS